MLARVVWGLAGLICTGLAVLGIYGFALFDAKPEMHDSGIGVGGMCFFGAFIAACVAWFFFSAAFARRPPSAS